MQFLANAMQFFCLQYKCVIFAYSKNDVFEYFCILESLKDLELHKFGMTGKLRLVDSMSPIVFMCDDVSCSETIF